MLIDNIKKKKTKSFVEEIIQKINAKKISIRINTYKYKYNIHDFFVTV